MKFPNEKIDGIDLAEVARSANLHRLTMIDKLVALRMSRQDAEAFTDYYFARTAEVNHRGSENPYNHLSQEQYDRLIDQAD